MDTGFTMASPEKYSSSSRDRAVTVNFACQRCCQPLKLHSSFSELDDQTISELTVPLYPNSEDGNDFLQNFQQSSDDITRRLVLPVKFEEVSSDFMVVGELGNKPSDSQQTLRVSGALFNIMSDQSDIDHPLCEECTDSLLDQMDQQLKIDEDECKEYRDFLEHLEMGNDEDDLEKLQEDLQKLQTEEEQLQKELGEIEEEEEEMKKMIKACKEENEIVQREEEKYWQEYCRLKRQLLLCADDQRSVDNQLKYAEAHLDKLRKTNVFNATFHIWHSGHFGTINNFRLGRLPNVPVEWTEIDAAWGQTVLLLHSLAKKIGLTFERYRLVPYGNHSYLESLEDKSKELPLYFMGGFKFFWDTKFDQAMVAFLDCLQQFKEKVEEGDTTFHLPYPMEKGKISDDSTGKSYSIKIQFNSEEQWTKALKFMLTNLKWALAWVSTQFQDGSEK